ncbi:RES domain-containing protein [Sphaerotilus natans subsp. natans DSM 6575]|uniref:RES domain-containing protein n=1 Tax=Sphaerotilus natans subsp. natans DSM 6575 TaxID=1286631 RepID=A0A059KP44_9BURK|nr:RES family NAD+ phosphorylase [Sphaerotilus natans]KDB52984.1 RES domain-containing protein [Sphaerotilus natans subsp. natans DSM 6575]SIQ32734.1 RES domain-containing protein [Sphaerotilus natans]
MKLSDLTYCQEHTLPRLHSMYRIQRTRRTASTVAVGPVRLPPTGLMSGRFDLPDTPVGYFAEEPETAAYETLARREAHVLSIADLRQRSLLWVQLTEPVLLLDLRPHAPTWPVLTSLRFGCTQELAADAVCHGYQGLIYRSAQQHEHDCYVLFGSALDRLRRVESIPLVDAATGGLHHLLRDVARGAQMPFVP